MKLTIQANIPERKFMEGLLNMYHSGYDIVLPFALYALAHSWHMDKFMYYWEMLK